MSLTNKKDDAAVTFPLINCINFVCFRWKAHPEVLDLSWPIGHQGTISLGSPKLSTFIEETGTTVLCEMTVIKCLFRAVRALLSQWQFPLTFKEEDLSPDVRNSVKASLTALVK